jgi:Na+-transporting NADH:ubiquinone oxidoreductase subunit C
VAAESVKKTIMVVLVICFVCAVLVSTAVVILQPKQEMNRRLEKMKHVIQVADLAEIEDDIEGIFSQQVSPILIDLRTGRELSEREYTIELNLKNYDFKKIIKNPELITKIPRQEDIAGLVTAPRYILLYRIKMGNQYNQLIFPVYGKGLWSTLYGFLSLDFSDLNTIRGITFYEHGETPGMGGEVDNSVWKKTWKGKKIFGKNGRVKLRVVKGSADRSSDHEIEGLSGATITGRGVENIIKFWFGKNGYGRYLKNLQKERIGG